MIRISQAGLGMTQSHEHTEQIGLTLHQDLDGLRHVREYISTVTIVALYYGESQFIGSPLSLITRSLSLPP